MESDGRCESDMRDLLLRPVFEGDLLVLDRHSLPPKLSRHGAEYQGIAVLFQ